MRYFIEIAYQGTHYHGWQIQPNAHTVQAEIERVLELILGKKIEITASGRTDTGVHAMQQFAHFDCETPLNHYTHLHKVNLLLPRDIVAKAIYQVADEAHARFDATERAYAYYLSSQKKPFQQGLYTYDHRTYNYEAMNQAAAILLQYQDFQAFSKVKTDVKTFDCIISEAKWVQEDDFYVFHITANRFLRGMVRAIVGTLLEVGKGRLNLKDFKMVIEQKDRRKAGHAAPPEGLFLSRVVYPYALQALK